MRFITLIAAALALLFPNTSASQVATPALFSPDRIVPTTNAFVASKLARAKGLAPSADGLEQIEMAQMLDPENKAVLQYVAFHAQGRGYPLRRYAGILEFLPDDPLAAYAVAELFAADGYHKLALPYYDRATKAYPKSLHYAYRAGLNAYFAGDYAACVRHLDVALSDRVTNQAADQFVKRAECHASLGQKAEAKRDFADAVKERAGNGSAWSTLMFRDGAYGGCSGTAASRTAAAIRFRDKGDRYKAYREVTIALQCNPNDAAALGVIVSLEIDDWNLKQHAQAHIIRRNDAGDGGKTSADYLAKSLSPLTPAQMLAEAEAINTLASPSTSDKVRAVYLTTRILKGDPDNLRARLIRGTALVNLNIPALAPMSWDDITRALKITPGYAPAHDVRAGWLERNKMTEEAIVEISIAIASKPDNPRYYRVRGDLLNRQGRTGPAIADLTTALRLAPNHKWTLMKRGEIYIATRNLPAAYADFEAASAADKSDLSAKVAMIRVLDLMGKTAEADAMHKALVAENRAADSNPYLTSRGKTFSADASAERTRAAAAARVQRADSEYRGIIADWNKVAECYDRHSAVVASVAGKVDREGRNGYAGMVSDVNRPCYKRAWDLTKRLSRFTISPDFNALTPGRQAQLREEIEPQLSRAFGDLLATRRMLGWSEEP